jgi:hypothetical protein
MATQCVSATPAHASRASAGTAATRATQKGVVMEDMKSELGATPRTTEVLMAEVRYGIVFGEMNEVFNGRIHRFLSFLWMSAAALSAGSLVTLIGKLDQSAVLPWTITLGIVAALAGAAQKAFKFHEREAAFRTAKAAFQELEGRGWSMNQSALQKELAKLLKNAPAGGSWLAPLAYNRACRELGYPDVQMPVHGAMKLAAPLVA